jgi:peptide chain release factor 2
LEELTHASDFWNDNQKAQGILKEISSHKKWIDTFAKLTRDLSDLGELAEMGGEDPEDIKAINESMDELEASVNKFEISSLLSGEDDFRDAFVTIHPGAGGTESQDWADMLFRMYNRWSERKGFAVELLDYQPGEEAGLKSASIKVKGEFAFGLLKAESGVHRLVRISPFDANAKRHTSFASVHVYPVIEDNVNIEIKDDDIRIDTYRASGAGGQHVNKTSSAIRITHFPTGIVVTCQTERSQHKNKETAMNMLKARLYQLQLEEQSKKMEKFEKTKKKIEWGSQIRSYVFAPYNMVKDHRTDAETGNTQAVMDGNIDMFIDAYLSDPNFREKKI